MNLLFGSIGNQGVPTDEATVRSTTEPVVQGGPPAVMHDAPEMSEVETDSNPLHSGNTPRQLASEWVEGQQYAPFWANKVDADAVNSDRINGQVSSAGYAASKEAGGTFGHGSASYAVGIEPTQGLTDAGKLGNDYFATPDRNIQEGVSNYMTVPPGYDHDIIASISDTAKEQARFAGQASLYQTWLQNGG